MKKNVLFLSMQELGKYIKAFTRLNRYRGAAPHKPILLLSVISGIEKGEIRENRIHITPALVAQFHDYWRQLVHTAAFTPNFALPFFHMRREKFWCLHSFIGREILVNSSHSIKSFRHLKEAVDYASLDEALYLLLLEPVTRELLRNALLDKYFNHARLSEQNEVIDEIASQILNEPATEYKKRAELFDEEEVFVRGGVFKREIPRIYNYTCCISGMRVVTGDAIQMIDACHIVPFSESHDDTICNGLSLCPNLHRAFDRGLIAIDEHYTVRVSPFKEENTIYSIRQFEGRQILLPANKDYYPSLENLGKHRRRFGW